MPENRIAQLEALLESQSENPLFRYMLGLEYLKEGESEKAVPHLRRALELDPQYSAAYRELGKALTALGATGEAIQVYQKGIQVAEEKGDLQTAKEMRVFLKRLEKKT